MYIIQDIICINRKSYKISENHIYYSKYHIYSQKVIYIIQDIIYIYRKSYKASESYIYYLKYHIYCLEVIYIHRKSYKVSKNNNTFFLFHRGKDIFVRKNLKKKLYSIKYLSHYYYAIQSNMIRRCTSHQFCCTVLIALRIFHRNPQERWFWTFHGIEINDHIFFTKIFF